MAMKRPFTDDNEIEHPDATAVLDTLSLSFQDKAMSWSLVFFHTEDQAKRFSAGEKIKPLKVESYYVRNTEFFEMLTADPEVYGKIIDTLEKRSIATKDRPNPAFDPKIPEDAKTNPSKISYFADAPQLDLSK